MALLPDGNPIDHVAAIRRDKLETYHDVCTRRAVTGDLSGPGPRAFLSANSLFEVPRLIEP
jgi:hypothetical protein